MQLEPLVATLAGKALPTDQPVRLAVDGKEVRGSGHHGAPCFLVGLVRHDDVVLDQVAALSKGQEPAARRPFALYVDEFQNLATSTFGVFLSESRKYGLSLTLAHQTLAQIGEELVSLILGNVGLQVVFGSTGGTPSGRSSSATPVTR